MKLIGMQVRRFFFKITSLGKVTQQDVRLKGSTSNSRPINSGISFIDGMKGTMLFLSSFVFGRLAIRGFELIDNSKPKLDPEIEEILRNIENRRKSLREPVVKASQDSSSCNDKDVNTLNKP